MNDRVDLFVCKRCQLLLLEFERTEMSTNNTFVSYNKHGEQEVEYDTNGVTSDYGSSYCSSCDKEVEYTIEVEIKTLEWLLEMTKHMGVPGLPINYFKVNEIALKDTFFPKKLLKTLILTGGIQTI